MRVPIPVAGPAYKSRALPISAQVTKGLFPEVNEQGKAFVSLVSYPGLSPWATLSGENRGLHVMNGVLYAVNGTTLYSVDSSGSETSIGTIAGKSRCDFANNGTQLVIVTGGPAYVYTVADGLSEITDPDLVNPTTVGYLNSQFIFDQNNGTNGEFVSSAVGDGTDVSALDFAQAESHPDDILRIVINNQLVHFFGSSVMEPWYNSGVGRPPFDRVQGGVKPYGLMGKDAVAPLNEFIYFVDNNRIPRVMSGLAVQSIGSNPLHKEWSGYETVDDAVAFAYTLDNQDFFHVTFPTADRTWIYHVASGSWCELGYGTDPCKHRAISYAHVYGKHIAADHTNGKLYQIDFDTFTDNGELIQRKRTTATIHGGLYEAPGQELFFEKVCFDFQTGEGLTTGQGSDPQVMIRYSDDRGRTWSAEDWHPLGEGGDYLKRVELYQQGSAYERIYEISFTDPVRFTLMGGQADISIGI